jgi:hypothetical protein
VVDAHRARIELMIKSNTISTVHQRLRDEYNLAVGITSFRNYVGMEFPDETDRDKVTVLRPDVPAGEEAQVDYGYLASWLDPVTDTGPSHLGLRDGARLQPSYVRPAGHQDGRFRIGFLA